MIGPYCSRNGVLVPALEAVIPVDDIHFAYGFGVYETLKVRNRILYFPEHHEERLFHSARIIGLEHPWRTGAVTGFTRDLVRANGTVNANIKVLLIGGDGPGEARLFIMALNPLYPDRKGYRDGGVAVIRPGERPFPQAKTLSMLISTRAFREARAAGAYDAVLRNREGFLTEGTRTNLFFTDGKTIYSPPEETILSGVTRRTIAETLAEVGMPLEERPLREEEIPRYAGFFLSSTSTKILPLRRLGSHEMEIPHVIRHLMALYDRYLERYAAGQEPLF